MKTMKYLVLLIATMLFMLGCKESYLDLANPNLQTTETFWKSESDIQKGVNAAYMSMAIYDGSFLRFAPIALDLRGDDMWSPSPWDVLYNTGKFNLANNSIMQNWLWIAFEGVVYRANQVLAHIDEVTYSSEAKKNQYKGEALFMRALGNYYLVTFFNNIPLVLQPYKTSADFWPGQATPEVVWTQIYADFNEASNLLPTTYSGSDIGRATKGAALTFLGKCYLRNLNFTDASAKFKAVIDLNIYGLMTNYHDNFTEAYENNKESVFEIQFSREVGGRDLGWVGEPGPNWSLTTARAITYAPVPFGWGDCAATQWIFNEFQIEKTTGGLDDPRLKSCVHYNYPGCTLYGKSFQTVYATNLGAIWVKKYCNDDATDGRIDEKDWRSGVNERLLRYSDVLLMYAECQNELNNRAVCAQYIQMVRNRASMPNREAEFAALTQEAMRDRIAHERALELALEGHRFEDVVRWGWLQDPAKLAILKAHDSEFNNYVTGREYFSIPQAQVELNPNLLQNPGY
ncbi:MAG: RagB/SusD family nutrient uptake outer membrane protein [Bacteroidota bacterium]